MCPAPQEVALHPPRAVREPHQGSTAQEAAELGFKPTHSGSTVPLLHTELTVWSLPIRSLPGRIPDLTGWQGRQSPGSGGGREDAGRTDRGLLRLPGKHAARGRQHRLPHADAWDAHVTHMHSHAHWAVPVTSFLGDSAQLESHTSESPRAGSSGRRESEEREPLGRQEVHRVSGCRRPQSSWRKAGEGRGVISWPWAGCWAWAGQSDYRGRGRWDGDNEVSAETQASFGAQRSPHNPCLEQGPWVGFLLPCGRQPGPLSLALWVVAPQGLEAPRILTRPAGSAAWIWNWNISVAEPKASF